MPGRLVGIGLCVLLALFAAAVFVAAVVGQVPVGP